MNKSDLFHNLALKIKGNEVKGKKKTLERLAELLFGNGC